jgi:hypothetical protein
MSRNVPTALAALATACSTNGGMRNNTKFSFEYRKGTEISVFSGLRGKITLIFILQT